MVMKEKAVSAAGTAGAIKAVNEAIALPIDCQPLANMRLIKVIVYSPGFTTIVNDYLDIMI